MIKIRNYTEEELKYIEDNYNTSTVKQIAEKLQKKESSICNAVIKLGLKKQDHRKWTDEEQRFLKANYLTMTNSEIAKHLNRTFNAISGQMDKLGLVRNKSWTSEEEQYLLDHFINMTHKEMGDVLGRTEGSVRAKCFDMNLYKNEIPWTEEEITYIKDHYMEMSNKEIAKVLNRTDNAIHIKASKMGLKKYPYYCDYHYFDNIDTEEKAYWLGFISADGWISKKDKTNSCSVGIELQYADIKHLQKFNKSISGNYKITDRWKTCSLSKNTEKKNHMCVIRIYSMIMHDALCDLGISNTKSYDLSIPKLKDDLIRHYLRGYFDGDGCLTITNKTFSVSIITASERFKNDFLSIMNLEEIIFTEASYVNEFGTIMYRPFLSSNEKKIKFLDYLYQDSSIYLDRKYKKYLKAKGKYTANKSLAA